MKFSHEVCRCDKEFNITKLYKSIGQVREDGLFHQNVFRVLKRDKEKGTRSWYNESYWIKKDDYIELYPEKWKEYINKITKI